MHIIGVIISLLTGVYTVNWGRVLWKEGNKAGAFWSFLLAVASTGASLWFFYSHGFFP